jgi:hypothetical protein
VGDAKRDLFDVIVERLCMAYLQYRPTKTLFQYTSADGMFGILRSKSLWFSDLRAANDPREIHLGFDKVIKVLRSIAERERGAKGALLLHLIERLTGYFQNQQVFCTCFSQATDELPMWAAYGHTYSGVAIGFRPSAILGIPARVYLVKYLERSGENDEVNKLAADIAAKVDRYRASNDIRHFILPSVEAIASIIGLKHQTWAYEKEVRMVYIQKRERPTDAEVEFTASLGPKAHLVRWREPHERVVGTRSVKYLVFPFGRFRDGTFDSSRAIKEIIVGPSCPLSVAEVEGELKAQGYRDCIVRKSDCHIRL